MLYNIIQEILINEKFTHRMRLRKLENKYNEAKQVGDIYHVAELSVAGMDRAISRMNRLL